MTPGIYIHNKSGVEYRLLDSRVRNCNPYAPQQLYVRSLENFKESFTKKEEI